MEGRSKFKREHEIVRLDVRNIIIMLNARDWHIPQKVLPRANHWAPDARAKSTGVEVRMRPATPPKRIPDDPV